MALLSLVSATQDNDFAKIYGVGYFEKSGKSGVSKASMAGGTEIIMTGSKFNPQIDYNLMQFYSEDYSATF